MGRCVQRKVDWEDVFVGDPVISRERSDRTNVYVKLMDVKKLKEGVADPKSSLRYGSIRFADDYLVRARRNSAAEEKALETLFEYTDCRCVLYKPCSRHRKQEEIWA